MNIVKNMSFRKFQLKRSADSKSAYFLRIVAPVKIDFRHFFDFYIFRHFGPRKGGGAKGGGGKVQKSTKHR